MTPSEISRIRKRIDAVKAERALALRMLQNASDARLEAEDAVLDAETALDAAQTVAESVQREAHGGIAGVVSRCLSSVFDSPYDFQLQFQRARDRTQARPVFLKGDEEIDPRTQAPGGVVDVAAFALLVACLIMSRPQPRKLLILDEPFRFVHGRVYRERVAELLLALAEELDMQIIFATGVREFVVGNVIELE